MKRSRSILFVFVGIADFAAMFVAIQTVLGINEIFGVIELFPCFAVISLLMSGIILCLVPFCEKFIENTVVAVTNALLCFGFWPTLFTMLMKEDPSVFSFTTIGLCVANFLLMFTARPSRDIRHLAHG